MYQLELHKWQFIFAKHALIWLLRIRILPEFVAYYFESLAIDKKRMWNKLTLTPFLGFVFFAALSFNAVAKDIVIVNVGESPDDKRILYKNELVRLALEITKEKYGDYEIVSNQHVMNITRAFRELETGENLTLTFAHNRQEFEEKALPIPISIRSGLDSYRLLVVKKGEESKFAAVKTIEDLKEFRVGLSPNWTTYNIMKRHGFEVVDAPYYNSMLSMLENNRFDFMPRALNEVYDELDTYKPIGDGLVVLPDLVLYIPSMSYMFVSRQQPRLYERLRTGLHALKVNGDLTKLSDKYFKRSINKAKIQNRRIITLSRSGIPYDFD